MKTKKKTAAASRFTRGERISAKSRHARKAGAGRHAEREAGQAEVPHVPDSDLPPA